MRGGNQINFCVRHFLVAVTPNRDYKGKCYIVVSTLFQLSRIPLKMKILSKILEGDF